MPLYEIDLGTPSGGNDVNVLFSHHDLLGVYDNQADAEQALQELIGAGIGQGDVRTVTPQDMRDGKTRSDYEEDEEQSIGEKISEFFSSIVGSSDEDKIGSRYLEAVRRGSTLVIVDANNDEQVDLAESLMSAQHSVDIDQRGSQWNKSGWSNYNENSPVYSDEEVAEERGRSGAVPSSAGADTTLTETQEELKVGKTQRQAGNVKIFQRVDEEQVSESVELEEQRASITRRAVDRPARQGDLEAFEEGSIEVQEYTEEPVVEKQSRVTGEVDVGIEHTQTTETVSDTVRRTTVEVDDSVNEGKNVKDEV